MEEGALELIQLRNNFYRDNYQRVLLALLLVIAINLALIGVLYYQLTHEPTPQYFAISNDGKIVKLYALTEPVIGPIALRQWASDTAVAAYTYDFVNYRNNLQNVQNRFTSDGWDNFQNALRASRNLDSVIEKKLAVSAIATGVPVVLDQGVVDGRYAWKVNLPILVTYQSATETTQQSLTVTMTITRVSIVNNPEGIAVASYVASESRMT